MGKHACVFSYPCVRCILDVCEFLRVGYDMNSLNMLCLHFYSKHEQSAIIEAKDQHTVLLIIAGVLSPLTCAHYATYAILEYFKK